MARCNWETFFEEFSDKILSYKDNRKELVEKIRDVFKQSDVYDWPLCGQDKNGRGVKLNYNGIDNLDPFTILNFVLRGGDKIKDLCHHIEFVFNLSNKFPSDYDGIGIPTPKPSGQQCLTWWFEKHNENNDKNVEYLWDLFEATIELRRDFNNQQTRDAFVYLYDTFDQFITSGWKVSSVSSLLYAVAPSTLIALNNPCVAYMNRHFNKFNRLLEDARASFDGSAYLQLCDDLKIELQHRNLVLGDISYNSFSETESQRKEKIDGLLANLGYGKRTTNGSDSRLFYTEKREKDNYRLIKLSPSSLEMTIYLTLVDASSQIVYFFSIPADTFGEEQFFVNEKDENKLNLTIIQKNGRFYNSKTPENQEKVDITNYLLLLFNYDIDENYNYYVVDKGDLNDIDVDAIAQNDESEKLIGKNEIYYGIPGCGKSFLIDRKILKNSENVERIVFHPDYTYSDFIGQLLPAIDSNNYPVYEFHRGPFTNILDKAIHGDHNTPYYLVIEEINRGNAPAIFGDIFQLLDRNEFGESVYSIKNADIAKEVYKNPAMSIKIPSNLFIICTMNTADQNVFTLDTAFKRRWNMIYVPDVFDSNTESDDIKNAVIGESSGKKNTGISWEIFHEVINSAIAKGSRLTTTEDKRLGCYFCSLDEIRDIEAFTNKVLRYLYDDVAKTNKNIFKIETFDQIYKSLEDYDGIDFFQAIFNNNILNELVDDAERRNEIKNTNRTGEE